MRCCQMPTGTLTLMSTMMLSSRSMRHALPSLLTLAMGTASASAQIRPPYIDDHSLCRPQPLPAVVQHLTGEAWKLDTKGKASPLQEGMTIDEQEGVRTAAAAFVSLALGDGSRVVLPSSSQVRLHLVETQSIPQVILEQGQAEVDARQGLLFKKQGDLKPVALLPAPRLIGCPPHRHRLAVADQ